MYCMACVINNVYIHYCYCTTYYRLFNYGIGVHLLQAEDPASMPPKKTEINPKDNHISFQVCNACLPLRRQDPDR